MRASAFLLPCTATPVGSFERVAAVSSSLSQQGFGKHWTILKSWGDLAPVLYGGTCALYFPSNSQWVQKQFKVKP